MVLRRVLLLAGSLLLTVNIPLFAQATSGLKGKVVDIMAYDKLFGPADYQYLVRFSKKHKEWIWEVHLEAQ